MTAGARPAPLASASAVKGGTAAPAAARVLLTVAYFFPPLGGGGVQRTVKFMKYLRPLGWRSEVITVRAADYWVLDPALAADVPADTVVHRTRALTGLSLLARLPGRARRVAGARGEQGGAVRSTPVLRWLRRATSACLIPDAYAGWFPFALAAAEARLAAGGVDALLTTSSPDTAHMVGLVCRERHAVPWVADFRDPWVRRLTFQAPTRLHLRLHEWLERRVLARADRVVVTNEATRDDFLRRHPDIPASRYAVIPNGFDPEDLALLRQESQPGPPAGSPADRQLVLAHTGLLSGKRTLGPFVAGVTALIATRPELRPRLALRQIGPRENVNDELVARAGLSDLVTFLPPVDHAQVLAEMAAADALLLLEADEPAGCLITPGKIFEYLASGRPILALVPEGPAAALVREGGGGVVLPPADAEGIAAVLARWLDQGPPAASPRQELLASYERPALAARLAALLDAIAGPG